MAWLRLQPPFSPPAESPKETRNGPLRKLSRRGARRAFSKLEFKFQDFLRRRAVALAARSTVPSSSRPNAGDSSSTISGGRATRPLHLRPHAFRDTYTPLEIAKDRSDIMTSAQDVPGARPPVTERVECNRPCSERVWTYPYRGEATTCASSSTSRADKRNALWNPSGRSRCRAGIRRAPSPNRRRRVAPLVVDSSSRPYSYIKRSILECANAMS